MFKSITVFDKEIAIQWDDKTNVYIDLIQLRKACPCAWCSGEKDVFGNIYRGDTKTLPSKSFQISSYEKVGLYGLRFNNLSYFGLLNIFYPNFLTSFPLGVLFFAINLSSPSF